VPHDGRTVEDPPPDLSAVADGQVMAGKRVTRDAVTGLRSLERMRLIADEGSLPLIRSRVLPDRMGHEARRGSNRSPPRRPPEGRCPASRRTHLLGQLAPWNTPHFRYQLTLSRSPDK
jgi:hypothetical protein